MPVTYTIVGLLLLEGGAVQVKLRAAGPLGGSAEVIVPSGSPAIVTLTIGREVTGTFVAN